MILPVRKNTAFSKETGVVTPSTPDAHSCSSSSAVIPLPNRFTPPSPSCSAVSDTASLTVLNSASPGCLSSRMLRARGSLSLLRRCKAHTRLFIDDAGNLVPSFLLVSSMNRENHLLIWAGSLL